MIHEGPGDFREDKQVGKPPETLKGRTLNEKIIRSGDKVMIAGVYSAEQEGLAPDPNTIMRPFHITVDGEELSSRKIRNRVKGITISLGLTFVTTCVYYLFFVPVYG